MVFQQKDRQELDRPGWPNRGLWRGDTPKGNAVEKAHGVEGNVDAGS